MSMPESWADWGGSFIDTSYNQPVYDTTVTSDLATQSQAVTTGSAGDGWGDWFKTIAGGVVAYAVQKDAIQNGIQQRANGQTSYPVGRIQQTPAQRQGLSLNNPLVLIGLAAFAFYAVKS